MTENMNKLNDKDVQDLTNSLYLIKGLYTQMASERDHLTSAISKILNATKQFQGYMEELEDQKEQITNTIEQTLHRESINIAKIFADMTYKEITGQANKILSTLENSISKANETLINYDSKERLFSKWFLALLFVAAIIGGLSSGALVRYYYTTVDEETRIRIKKGEMLESLELRVNPKERERLKALLNQ